MPIRSLLLALCLILSPVWAAPPPPEAELDLTRTGDSELFAGRDVVFFAEDLGSGLRYALQPERTRERHRPFSSFKIPNLVIALETGVCQDLETKIHWDPSRRPERSFWPEDWKQNQTLASAFRRSCVWYFQDIAIRVGAEKYRGYLRHFGYGNAEVPLGSDTFWLNGPLEVSPREQVGFLAQLLRGQLQIAQANLELLAQASELKSENGWVLHGKTGSGPVVGDDFEGPFEGWFVGWIERPEQEPVVFALWTEAPSYEAIRTFRRETAELLLRRAGALPEDW